MGNSARERSTLRIGSIPLESASRRAEAMLGVVRYFVERILSEKTIAGRQEVRKELFEVLGRVDSDGNPVYSDEDQQRIIKGVESRLRISKVSTKRLDATEVQKKRISGIRKKKLPRSDGWTPDFMKSLTESLYIDK